MSLDKLGGTVEQRLGFIMEFLGTILGELQTMNRLLASMADEEEESEDDCNP